MKFQKKTVAAAAVCCVIAVGGIIWGVTKGGDGPRSVPADQGNTNASDQGDAQGTPKGAGEEETKIAPAQDYDELYQYLQAEKKSGGQDYGGISSNEMQIAEDSTAAMGTSSDNRGTLGYSETNVREAGVEEGDIVKTDGKNLYILNNQKVQIVNIEDNEMKQAGTIRLEEDEGISEIYVRDKDLVLFATKTEYDEQEDPYGSTYRQYAEALTYDVTNPEKPKLKGKVTQSGSFDTMRVSGEYVYLFSTFYADLSAARNATDRYIPSIQGEYVDSGSIFLPQYTRGSQYTVVSGFSLKNPGEKTDGKAIFGCSGTVYVSTNNIYVCEAYYNSNESDVTQTCIRKVAYEDGKLEAVGQTKVDGTLNDSFSIDEYDGFLRLVTTVSPALDNSVYPIVLFGESTASNKDENEENKKDSNSLYILDEKLQETGKIEGLAEDEQVYSARFLGDVGYFVTYRQIDPLFSVDLSDPEKPKVIGELKLPGFSEYLHAYGDGLLLGIGMDMDETGTTTEGVKMSMFDITNPADVEEVQKYILEDCYSTDVAYNYKSVLIDVDKNLIGFTAHGQGSSYYIFSYEDQEGFQCQFERELNGYSDVRGVYVGDVFYLVSGNTVESYQMKGFEKLDDIVL